MNYDLRELQELVNKLGYSLDDLDDIEILAACTGVSCEAGCQLGCQTPCQNATK